MELSEAISILKHERKITELYGHESCITNIETIDTVLRALEEYEKQMDLDYVDKNYISKEYHEMTIKEQNDIINDLKNRLDNSISKDKVIKKIEEYHDFFISSPEEYRKNHCRVAEVVLKELLGEE